ncbi:MAG: hypothetical protein JNL96_27285 [Planctomycetaceae bacterium]|nr:hypothetical protein [Planctomycetaceae bacterium]
MQRSTRWLLFAYALVVAATTLGMNVARNRTLASFDNTAAKAEWDEWREETKRQAENPTGPVKRREAKAQEPPMLILMRDHFPAAVGTTLLAVSFFFWFFAITIRGSLRTPPPNDSTAAPRGIASTAPGGRP